MREAVFLNTFAGIESSISFDTAKKSITIHWFRTAPKHFSLQTFELGYYPTSVAGMDGNRLLVAGKHPRTHATVIEIWELDSLSAIPGSAFKPSTREITWPNILVPIKSKTEVYNEAAVGQDMVFAMFWNLGDKDSAFLQFHDSKDLYSLDLTKRLATRILTASPTPKLPTETKLTWDFNDRSSIRHSALGDVYMFFRSSSNDHRALAIFDSNQDGILDFTDTISVGSTEEITNWYASGIMDSKLIESHW
jgi:hypothetical protein